MKKPEIKKCIFGWDVFRHDGSYIESEEQANAYKDMVESLISIKEAINEKYSDDFVFEDDFNEDSHLGKITITVKEARLVIDSLKKAGCI